MPEPVQTAYGVSLRQKLLEPLISLRLLGSRAVLALIGIAVGCGSFIALLNIGYNAEIQSMAVFKDMGSDLLVAHIQSSSETRQLPIGTPAALRNTEIRKALADILASSTLAVTVIEARISGRTFNTMVAGVTPELASVLDLKTSQGRFLSQYDMRSIYAVLGRNAAISMSANGVTVAPGEHVQLGDYVFQVAGILEGRGHNPIIPIAIDDIILIPIESMRRITPFPRISTILARSDSNNLQDSASRLKGYLQPLLPDHTIDVQIPEQLLSGIAQQSRLFSWLLAGLGGISLLVGGVGIMNVMLMSVTERKREIGIRMAVGARPRDIAWLFLLEAVALAFVGASLGIFFGSGAAWLFSLLSGWTAFSLSPMSVLAGAGSSILTGLFFGLNPALSASRLQPVQALRDA